MALHERVGHDGLDYLLGTNQHFANRWTTFLQQVQKEHRTELDAIAAEKGYENLAGKDDQLALEWFARRVENNPALLERPGMLREAWQALRELVADLQAKLGLKVQQGRAFDDQVRDLMFRARRAALKGKNVPNQEGGSLIRSAAGAGAESGADQETQNTPRRLSEVNAKTIEAKAIRDALPSRGYPAALIEGPDPKKALAWWEKQMVGQTIATPIGVTFTPKPGHFFRFIAGGTPGQRKGYIGSFDSAEAAIAAIRQGSVVSDHIPGWQDLRAHHLPLVPDILQKPDVVVYADGERPTIKFIKRYHGAWNVVGFLLEDGQLAPLSFSPRKSKENWLVGERLIYASPELGEARPKLAPPPSRADEWSGQNRANLLNQYPLLSGKVNAGEGHLRLSQPRR